MFEITLASFPIVCTCMQDLPTVVRRQAWKYDELYFTQAIGDVLLENGQADSADMQQGEM